MPPAMSKPQRKHALDRKQLNHQFHDTIFKRNTATAVKIHAVYAVVYLGHTQSFVAHMFGKSPSAISKWVSIFESGLLHDDKVKSKRFLKFLPEQREWILNLIQKDPLIYLQELSKKFQRNFNATISLTSIWLILKEANYTHKVLERRAKEISFDEISRFTREINLIHPLMGQLVFLDEMSTDNRAMLRKRGWFLKNSAPIYFSLFRRGTRLSILSFLSCNGLIETYQTPGTFTRLVFLDCVKKLLDSGKIQKYPGRGSVWIMDGASIHVDQSMIEYCTQRGIHIIFLPAYCPFYNPIEVIFGLVKRRCRELYDPSDYGSEQAILLQVLQEFTRYDCSQIFRHCGYGFNGDFNPHVNHEVFMKEVLFLQPLEE
eukprot:Pompholyxophrys_sp_v1_NODE_144_length_1580_cov_7.482623.p1 type:complete len:373 gc:universal NODE_144_length_1580_cov_7.482623:399-1517(+)